ncbi:MAG: 30S ribosomal protein S18 [Planctomycetota bacterium]|nr:30S ribosomal protein S18 [Planctomycetota bacterium]
MKELRKMMVRKKSQCRFCKWKDKTIIDYKDIQLLQKFYNQQSKITARRRNGNCIKHQRKIERAIKLARYMALIPYTGMR